MRLVFFPIVDLSHVFNLSEKCKYKLINVYCCQLLLHYLNLFKTDKTIQLLWTRKYFKPIKFIIFVYLIINKLFLNNIL